MGAQDYDFGGQPVTLNAWHQDQVVALPPGAQVAGRNAFCENAALIYGDRAFTVQAHPEFGDDFIQGLMDTRAKGVVPDDLLAGAAARMGQADGASLLADRIEAFFKQPAPWREPVRCRMSDWTDNCPGRARLHVGAPPGRGRMHRGRHGGRGARQRRCPRRNSRVRNQF